MSVGDGAGLPAGGVAFLLGLGRVAVEVPGRDAAVDVAGAADGRAATF
jgi:hypothetical protein